jgi:hypothetical protein
MPPRLLKILITTTFILALVLAGLYWMHRPRHSQRPFTASLDAAQKVTLQTGSTQIELIRDSATWTVSSGSKGPYKAESEHVKSLLNSLKEVQVEDVISERSDATEFQLNPGSATQVTLLGKNNAPLATGLFGKQAPDGAHSYFKYPDQTAIYLARGGIRNDLVEAGVNSWRNPTLLNASEDQVLTLLIEGPGFKTALARSSDTWSCNGRPIDPTPVWGLLGQLVHLRAEEFADPVQHPELAASRLTYATVILQQHDGTSHTLHIGPLDKKSTRHPVSIDADPNVAWIPEGIVKAILQKPSSFKSKKP